MTTRTPSATPSPALAAAVCAALSGIGPVLAQTAPADGGGTQRITISAPPVASVAGFGAQPLAASPLQASLIGSDDLLKAGATSLAGLTLLDASASDSYNTEGYWSYLSVRGFVLDNRSNYRRDGLPINAETAIGLANKERVELLRGASGIQAGISAPGGLANLVVKRPTAAPLRTATLEATGDGGVAAAVDLSDRFGADGAVGLRLNAAAARLRPAVRDAEGSRQLLALAGDLKVGTDGRLEAEFETSRQSQPSVPGFSLRGDVLPEPGAIDPRTNLNNQPWSLPVVLEGHTASLRWRQRLPDGWSFTAHGVAQRLRSDDRVAFPFGCYDAAANVYWPDRYCPDGSFDLYDFRSEGERRSTNAIDLKLAGGARWGGLAHDLTLGVLHQRTRDRFQRQAFNYAGSGRDDGSIATPDAPAPTDENTNRDERSTELYLRDAIELSDAWSLWLGLRHTRLERASVRTDGSRPIDYTQSFTTPWLAVQRVLPGGLRAYASWGQGIETDVAPNRARYVNAGQPLPALRSRQLEIGLKGGDGGEAGTAWSLAAFRITRPLAADIGPCDVDGSCERTIDGEAVHQGLEASLAWQRGPWGLAGSALWLDAERRGSRSAGLDGLRPTNVPAHALKARLSYDVAALPGLQWQAALVHEGQRMVLADNSLEAPAWTRIDLGARWAWSTAGARWSLRAGIDNVADARAWRDTPTQFGHVYLFPLAPRTVRVSLQAAL